MYMYWVENNINMYDMDFVKDYIFIFMYKFIDSF